MPHDLYWIDSPIGRIATMPKPRGGDGLDDDLRQLAALGVDLLVSLLETDETAELGLMDEAAACARTGIEFVGLPVPDCDVPRDAQRFRDLVDRLHHDLAKGRTVAIHCWAGIGRSSLLAAALLCAAGLAPATAFSRIAAARGRDVPDTEEQREWLEQLVKGDATGDRSRKTDEVE
jgi:protein-tyrosine phosphatase